MLLQFNVKMSKQIKQIKKKKKINDYYLERKILRIVNHG
jgi:hypothetical protein